MKMNNTPKGKPLEKKQQIISKEFNNAKFKTSKLFRPPAKMRGRFCARFSRPGRTPGRQPETLTQGPVVAGALCMPLEVGSSVLACRVYAIVTIFRHEYCGYVTILFGGEERWFHCIWLCGAVFYEIPPGRHLPHCAEPVVRFGTCFKYHTVYI